MNQNNLSIVGRLQNVLDALGSREPSTAHEAAAVIENIRISKGHLDNEVRQDLENLQPQNRAIMLAFVQRNQEIEAAYTRDISEQLYSSKYRFLYELIQNADDSSFERATAERAAPYVHFELTDESLTMDTNEDGFTRANVEAICATGKSSKRAPTAQEHIGEKGFGFKSVFSIANEVHIRSGIWSFRFQHQDGESGLGMVTPLEAPMAALPDGVRTRITLKLADTAEDGFARLVSAMTEIPKTTIFFLQRLQEIKFSIHESSQPIQAISITKFYIPSTPQVKITRSREFFGRSSQDISVFFHFQREKKDMPHDRRRPGKSSVKIDLAFPVNSTDYKPKLSPGGQYVFAFLPLQKIGQIPFLIQSDFITVANRESVIDCPWNNAICGGVAEAFQWTVKNHFAKASHPLEYAWLDYVPAGSTNRPWTDLYENIVQSLKEEPVLQSWEQQQYKIPRQLRRLPPVMLHDNQPILKDHNEEVYLSPKYDRKHYRLLEDLGAINISWSHIIDRIGQDLVSTESRLKTKPGNDRWHEAFARLVKLGLESSSAIDQQRIKRLAIIPLTGGVRWTGATGVTGGQSTVYFPVTDSIPIPTSIWLVLVEPTAALNPQRRALYAALGVTDCPKEIVFAKIKKRHQGRVEPSGIPSHLRYLFHFHLQPDEIRSWACVPLINGSTEKASSKHIYLPSNYEYDMYQLLPEKVRTDPNCFAKFLPSSLINLEAPTVLVRGMSWQTWLARITKARSRPYFRMTGSAFAAPSLSLDLRTILEHNPTKFLGTLKAHWKSWQPDVHSILSDLRSSLVPCRNGVSEQLCRTYLPAPRVVSKIRELGIEDTEFNLLILPGDELDEATYMEWQFLDRFGVKSEPDITFYKIALKAMHLQDITVNATEVKEAYRCIARSAVFEDHEDLRLFFDEEASIWDNSSKDWVSREECIWQGPDFLRYRTVLSSLYGGDPLLNSLFITILQIPGWTLDVILEELKLRQESGLTRTEVPLAQEIYAFLNGNTSTDNDWQTIKVAFLADRLVLGEHNKWHSSRTCLWSTAFNLDGYQDLSNMYPDLEDFFVRRLGVKKASPSMLINEVRRMAMQSQPQISGIRTRLLEIGLLIAKTEAIANISKALDALKEVKFLPKKLANGTTVLVQVTDEFAVSDHLRYRNAFTGRDVLLDFQVVEVQGLHVLFRQLGITDRYLSTAVKEVSKVGDDSIEDEGLSKDLQAKAYALYCCAAKGKSIKALRGDRALFDLLKSTIINKSNDISTHLELPLTTQTLSVETDRAFVHHEIVDGQLKIYVPAESRQRQACYRSQLPGLLAGIMDVTGSSTFNISSIIACNLRDLTDILVEQDISTVDWIEPPPLTIPDLPNNELPRTPTAANQAHSVFDESDAATLVSAESGRATPRTPTQFDVHPETSQAHYAQASQIQTPLPALYPRLVEHVVQSAQRASYRQSNARDAASNTPPPINNFSEFDHTATFGNRNLNEFLHDRRIGAAGEAFVFEILSALSLPNFTRDNWQSTIRGELASAPHYTGMQNWAGRETADIVYSDRTGALTQYLRSKCTGAFPVQIPANHDHTSSPIEYYLEVKSSTGACSTRFFLSSGQFRRMETTALRENEQPTQVYVIMRVFDLTTQNVGMKIFVDPLSLGLEYVEFEAQGWVGRAR